MFKICVIFDYYYMQKYSDRYVPLFFCLMVVILIYSAWSLITQTIFTTTINITSLRTLVQKYDLHNPLYHLLFKVEI
jgi:hypothetical protein